VLHVALEDVPAGKAALEKLAHSPPERALSEPGHQEPDVDPKAPARGLESFVDGLFLQARRRDLVEKCDVGVEPRLERELPQKAETERVDGGDVQLEEPVPHLAPERRLLAELFDDAGLHLARRLAGEGDGEDMARRRARFEEAQVAIDETASPVPPTPRGRR
jgi:hypothetical protein